VRNAQRDGKPQQPAAVARAQALQEEIHLEQRMAQQAARLRESSAVKGNSSAAKIGNEQSAQLVVNKNAAQVITSSPSGGGVAGTASDAAAGAQENGARGDRVATVPSAPVMTTPPAASVVSGNMRTQVLSEVLAQEQASDKAEAPARMLAARGLTALASQKGGSITMRLDPPMLGELTIRMTVTKGVVEASMQTATHAARLILERGADQLRTSLEARGLSVERLSIHGPAHQSETSGARADGGREEGARGQGTGSNDEHREDAAGEESRGRSDRDGSSAQQHAPADESFSSMIDATTLSEEAA
jgi:flagellar hook-length control protein FliK